MRSLRSLYWPGFILGMLLMTGLSCTGLAMVLGLNELTLLDLQASGEPIWTPPPPTPTSDAPVAEAPRSLAESDAFSFRPGETVRNVTASRVNIRRSPGHQGKPGDDVIAQAQPGDQVVVVAGPQEADGLLWWRVQYRTSAGADVEGWMAEATGSGVTIMGP